MEYANKIITIGDINLNLDIDMKFEGDVDAIRAYQVEKIRGTIGNLTLLGTIKVNKFYKSEMNTYEYIDIDNTVETMNSLQEFIEKMKVNDAILEKALKDEVFLEFVTTVTIWSKVLTCIYVLLKVSAESCSKGKTDVDTLTKSKDEEIEKLTNLLKETSNLLFSMDSVEDVNLTKDDPSINNQ